MSKSPDAFRTISEVAEWLGIQAHVLRFWESKFTQIKPIKRAGGRRYYRPTDMLLLGGIKKLLHDDGLTIKGVQKILREDGMSHVADLSQPLDDLTLSEVEEEMARASLPSEEQPQDMAERGVVLNFESSMPDAVRDRQQTPNAEEEVQEGFAFEPEPEADPEDLMPAEASAPETVPTDVAEDEIGASSPQNAVPPEAEGEKRAPVDEMMQETPAKAADILPEAVDREPAPIAAEPPQEPEAAGSEPVQEASPSEPAEEERQDQTPTARDTEADAADTDPETQMPSPPAETAQPAASLPAFLHRPLTEPEPPNPDAAEPVDAEAPESETAEPSDAEAEPAGATPKPRIVEVPRLFTEAQIDAEPGTLCAAYRLKEIPSAQARDMAPLLTRLTALRDDMAARRRNTSSSDTSN